jgi:hypothetical protein
MVITGASLPRDDKSAGIPPSAALADKWKHESLFRKELEARGIRAQMGPTKIEVLGRLDIPRAQNPQSYRLV